MKKALELIGAAALSVVLVGMVIAAAVSEPAVTLSKVSPSGGMEMRDIIITDLETIATAVGTAAIDGGAGSFTTLVASGLSTLTGNAVANEIDARTATPLLLGEATATGVTVGAADAHTTIAGNLLASDVDAATAETLLLGKATATKVEIAKPSVETEIQGTLDVHEAANFASTVEITGVATLTVAPTLTVTETAESQTLTMTNAPAGATAAKDTPIYIKITVGATDYVIPAWALSE